MMRALRPYYEGITTSVSRNRNKHQHKTHRFDLAQFGHQRVKVVARLIGDAHVLEDITWTLAAVEHVVDQVDQGRVDALALRAGCGGGVEAALENVVKCAALCCCGVCCADGDVLEALDLDAVLTIGMICAFVHLRRQRLALRDGRTVTCMC